MVVADALSCKPKVENLSFTKIKSSLFDSVCGKYEQDPTSKTQLTKMCGTCY